MPGIVVSDSHREQPAGFSRIQARIRNRVLSLLGPLRTRPVWRFLTGGKGSPPKTHYQTRCADGKFLTRSGSLRNAAENSYRLRPTFNPSLPGMITLSKYMP
jgi:hypothetical protein